MNGYHRGACLAIAVAPYENVGPPLPGLLATYGLLNLPKNLPSRHEVSLVM